VLERLSRSLSGAQLQSLLMEVMRARAAARTPAEILRQYATDRFVQPASIDPRLSLAIDAELFEAAAAFEPIELSPVTPLGSCSCLALTDQNRSLAALRSSEVVSDPTNVLALECARRLRSRSRADVHLATSQRVLRAQPVPKLPGYAPHFRLFVLASGGLERDSHAFTVATVVGHVRVMLDALTRLERRGFPLAKRNLELRASARCAEVADRIAAQLGVAVGRAGLDHPYYCGGLRYTIWLETAHGPAIALADGGTFDWLAQLTSNRRAVYVASGLGSQLIAFLRMQVPPAG
jgi:hypothetical protein